MRMLRITALFAFLCALLSIGGCSDESQVVSAPVDDAALKGNAVAFEAKIRNTIEFVSPPPIIHAIFEGEGKARPFGPFTLYATSEIDVTVFPANQETDFILTFRNGDQLFGFAAGTGIEDPPGTNTFQGELTWTGGTGIFANVSGTGTYAGTADSFALTGDWGMEGVIAGFGGPGY